jgi:ubiquinone biosynthesis protein
MFELIESGRRRSRAEGRNQDPKRPMTNQDDEVGRESRVREHLTALHRVWELWRRVARDVIVVVRHWVLYLVSCLRIHLVGSGRTRRTAGPTGRRATAAQHTRVAIEELGPTAIKLGQMLSTRNDVLPPDWQHELTRLQDAAPLVPPAAIRATIVEELSRPMHELFDSFVDAPLACASIGQAHAAKPPGGTDVVVKVRRPGVVDEVERDLEVITSVVALLSRWSRHVRSRDAMDLVDQFSTTLRHELDYLREANNVERFAANFADDPDIRIPAVHHELSTARVLTLERLGGFKIDDLDALAAAGIDRVALAQRATSLVLRSIFEHGFFHADPHPGNFFIEPSGRIGLIDFGMVGEVDPATRAALTSVLVALVTTDAGPLVEGNVRLGISRESTDTDAFVADLNELMATDLSKPLGELSLGHVLSSVLAIVRRHHLRFPSNLALLAKTLGMCEGLAAHLDPQFRMTEAITPYVAQLLASPPSDASVD